MSVSRRVVVSIAVLMVLAFGSLGYQLWVIARMQRGNEELSKVNFRAAGLLLEMQAEGLDVQSYTRKYFVLSSPALRQQTKENLENSVRRFNERFQSLEQALRHWQPVEEIALLSTAWIDYQNYLVEALRMDPPPDEVPANLAAAVGQVRIRTDSSYKALTQSISDQVERNRTLGSQAQTFSLLVGVVFLITGSALAYLMIRTINVPLQELTRGTRNISSGRFTHRLSEEGPLEFAELARDFNKMTEKLGELDQMKKDFVSHVSHELKAPLAAIRQTLAVTMEQIPGPINEQQRRLLQLSRNSAERLTAMVANLLDVSRLEAGTMEYEMGSHDLHELAKAVAEEFELNAAERGIKITVTSTDPLMPVSCDHDRMIQVVGNLIDNALKFSPANSTVAVNLERNGNSEITLSVADRGTGVPDDHKHAVFEKFHQVKGGGKRAVGQGVGLGLAICKTIVTAHRGTIWVEDNPGGGSIFRLEMRALTKQETVKCG
jgi:signal transduction histidine kinase